MIKERDQEKGYQADFVGCGMQHGEFFEPYQRDYGAERARSEHDHDNGKYAVIQRLHVGYYNVGTGQSQQHVGYGVGSRTEPAIGFQRSGYNSVEQIRNARQRVYDVKSRFVRGHKHYCHGGGYSV